MEPESLTGKTNFCHFGLTDPLGVQAKKVRMEGDLEVSICQNSVFTS